jgi:hypothetical protein
MEDGMNSCDEYEETLKEREEKGRDAKMKTDLEVEE